MTGGSTYLTSPLMLHNQPFTSPCLWSGRLAGVVDPHSYQQLACGFLPYCWQGGLCEVWGGSANLWYAAAKALGFNISTICCLNPLMVCQVASLCMGVKSLAPLPGRLQCPPRLPDVVFLDLASLPLGSDSTEYWWVWQMLHIFYCLGVNDSVLTGVVSNSLGAGLAVAVPTPLPGWTARLVCLAHYETGGPPQATGPTLCGIPPGFPWVELLVWEPWGGTPLLCCVNNLASSITAFVVQA